jgi:hypothetical protein
MRSLCAAVNLGEITIHSPQAIDTRQSLLLGGVFDLENLYRRRVAIFVH